jgi:hypothetical protein
MSSQKASKFCTIQHQLESMTPEEQVVLIQVYNRVEKRLEVELLKESCIGSTQGSSSLASSARKKFVISKSRCNKVPSHGLSFEPPSTKNLWKVQPRHIGKAAQSHTAPPTHFQPAIDDSMAEQRQT